MMRALKIAGWLVMAALAWLMALAAFRYFIVSPEAAIEPPLAQRFTEYVTPLLFHAGASLLALALGPFGFWTRFRDGYLGLHRWLGRVYLLAVLVGGSAGFYLSFTAFGGLPARIGFGLLAALWLGTAWMAYRSIRARRTQVHREWMIRNYALTFSAVMLRVWLFCFLSLGFEFSEAYTTVAWLCWVPNLLVAELWVRNAKAIAARRGAKLGRASLPAA